MRPEELEEMTKLWRRLEEWGGMGVSDFNAFVALLMKTAVELAEASPDHPAAQAVLAGAGRGSVQRKLF